MENFIRKRYCLNIKIASSMAKIVTAFWHHFAPEICIMDPPSAIYSSVVSVTTTICPASQKLDIEWE